MSETVEPPWSVAWTGEQAFRLQPSDEFLGRTELAQKEARGAGEPIYAAMHVSRQRRAMARHLCHVCGEPTTPDDRYIFPTASGALVTLHDGSQQYGCNVPAMHLACADRALAACPHLQHFAEPPLKCDADEGRLIERTDVTPELQGVAHLLPPNSQVVLSCYRLYGPEFTAKVLAARAAWDAAVRERR